MQLVHYPDPRLLVICKHNNFTTIEERRTIAYKMFKIMNDNKGVGLAAPQVGLNIRMFVWNHNGYGQSIWNPILDCLSGEMVSKEGCLSIPEVNVTIQRAISSILLGEGINGKKLKFIGGKNTTRIWQHEIDHLDGKLIIDNMNRGDTIINKEALRELLKNTVA